jgi:hypothetical protein
MVCALALVGLSQHRLRAALAPSAPERQPVLV